MSRRGRSDVIVVGGGVVGAACALALAAQDLDVELVEGQVPASWSAQQPDLRVYAFAPDNAALLEQLGVWNAVRATRAQAYRRMRVWDAAGGGELTFDADRMGRTQLGWIIEHSLLADRLWAALPAAGVQVRCPARVEAMEQDASGVRLRLDDGARLEARLVVAADGAGSTLRQLAGLPVQGHDYAQRGVVAYLRSEGPHEDTAWQRFLPTGPLAVLPCTDGRSSIVWTLSQDEAARVLALDDTAFSRELTTAFGGRLGELTLDSPRAAFPLKLQLAQQYVEGRVVAIGDAAHVVHPLAGQGVNLGLRDVAGLQHLVADAQARRADWDTPHRLQRWARTRRSENAVAAYTFDGINRLFSTDELHTTLARGPLLGLAGKLPPLTALLWRRAAGL
ncbi:2-octaprenyl-6-methoxyphenol hydroxylase /2-octaprenyl-3-methyl-6-methoxy-1,4-benzoquinol hydroxylase [Pseudoxanthomonas sp. GM95]|uniref:UbiH/UbiF family hydroxylase n=1 Tax=Pseudoxanthomonas sp. GM95 TaxID=1881043 RepID=UPI0008C8CAA1|nr:UbiH/UbiF family hydroxylase [Pseudoxanthomonas sp. GM95]SEL74181.1 2-octaprenyl-6-methoxyphenol hydroxylase /2-octaprenyl-3-methyl-6-methoxy-1,4-benzoquinol hydroxylase [Pseudoxanthomonas sp. GM95]